ncbi:hypothetical protein PIB30_045058 [Stylosanthes scabra]|uniref:Uncharacterized protein n=1 Tax=Stylosanthes scabra TaxID=79078 RepID=A0ABU6UFB2_9FABA|nr:hypothetical protein [Stylosanthes scabra]
MNIQARKYVLKRSLLLKRERVPPHNGHPMPNEYDVVELLGFRRDHRARYGPTVWPSVHLCAFWRHNEAPEPTAKPSCFVAVDFLFYRRPGRRAPFAGSFLHHRSSIFDAVTAVVLLVLGGF